MKWVRNLISFLLYLQGLEASISQVYLGSREIKWKTKEALYVSIKKLKGLDVDDATKQALNDWVYLNSQGYSF
jgi:hypothetical protein